MSATPWLDRWRRLTDRFRTPEVQVFKSPEALRLEADFYEETDPEFAAMLRALADQEP